MVMKKTTVVITKTFSKELDKPDTYENTHRHAFQAELDGEAVWFSLPSNKMDAIMIEEDDAWKVVGAGSTVFIKYDEVAKGEAIYRNVKKSDFTVTDLVEGKKFEPKAAQQEKAKEGVQKAVYAAKDMTGVKVGHAINGAMNFLKNSPTDLSDLLETAKVVHEITEKLRAKYKEAHPKVSDYDIGASTGHAVLNALKVVEDLDAVEEYALQLLDTVVVELEEFIRKGSTPAPAKKAPAKAPVVKKTPAKKTKPVEEVPPANTDNFDDDCPFN